MAQHRTASHVVQRALTYSDDQGQGLIVQAELVSHGFCHASHMVSSLFFTFSFVLFCFLWHFINFLCASLYFGCVNSVSSCVGNAAGSDPVAGRDVFAQSGHGPLRQFRGGGLDLWRLWVGG